MSKLILILLSALATLLAATEKKEGQSAISIRAKCAIVIALITALISVFGVYKETDNTKTLQAQALSQILLAARNSMLALDNSIVLLSSHDPTNDMSPSPNPNISDHKDSLINIEDAGVAFFADLNGYQRGIIIELQQIIRRVITKADSMTIVSAHLAMSGISKQAIFLCETTKPESYGLKPLCDDDLKNYYSKGGYAHILHQDKQRSRSQLNP